MDVLSMPLEILSIANAMIRESPLPNLSTPKLRAERVRTRL
jgi:hypothetical protein